MRQRQVALNSLIAEKSAAAMAALSAAEVAVPSRSEAAAVSAAVRAAAARRTEEWLKLANDDPIDDLPFDIDFGNLPPLD